jgi:hypothetical protein
MNSPEGQTDLGLVPYAYAAGDNGLGVWMFVSFSRLAKRAKCSVCGARRILFVVKMGEIATSPGYCAKCSSIR